MVCKSIAERETGTERIGLVSFFSLLFQPGTAHSDPHRIVQPVPFALKFGIQIGVRLLHIRLILQIACIGVIRKSLCMFQSGA